MTKIYSKKFTETFFKSENDIILTSPYRTNNIIIFLSLKDDMAVSQIFKYIFDPLEPEIKFACEVQKNQELESVLKLKLQIKFLLPGRIKNELIIVSKNGDIWSGFEKENSINLSKRLGRIDFSDIEENSLDFFDLFDPIDIVAYFTKKTKDFACIVIKEQDRFYLLLNIELFSKIEPENSTIEFLDSLALWNSTAENLDLFSFNKTLGLANISFPRNKINKELPLSIINLKKFEGIPKDICAINDALYVITQEKFHIYPSFKKYRTLTSLSLPFSPELIWFEPQFKRCKVVSGGGNLSDFVISPTLSEISTKNIPVENKEKVYCYENSKIKCTGNKHFGIIYSGEQCYIWTKREHISTLKTHNLTILELHNPTPDALESLQRLKDLNLMDFGQILSITEAGLPRSLLKLRKRRIRFFTKEDDLYIIKNVYSKLTYLEIAKKLKRNPISIYTHVKMTFGTPVCDNHNAFHKRCNKCSDVRIIWEEECEERIRNIEYRISSIKEDELPEFDLEEFIWKDKKRRFRNRTSFFESILSPELYNQIVDFIISTDLLKGRSVNKIFEQTIQIFIDELLKNCINSGKTVTNSLLELYFSIKKDLKTLSVIYKPYKEKINPDYSPLGDLIFFFKDIMNLRKLYGEEIYRKLKPFLIDFNKDLSKRGIKDGYFAGLLYLIYKQIGKRFTQSKLAKTFLITEVTLRSRISDVRYLMNRQDSLEYMSKIVNIIRNNKTIQELKQEEKSLINQFNTNIENSIYHLTFENIPGLISPLKINYREDNLPLVLKSLELISRIEDNSIISALTDFLIDMDCCSDVIFNNLIRFLGSADKIIVRDIQKLVYSYKPDLEDADLYKIIDSLSKEQITSIFSYIQSNQSRNEKRQDLMSYIEKNYEIFNK